MDSIWNVFESYAGRSNTHRISWRCRHATIFPAGMLLVGGLCGFFAGVQPAHSGTRALCYDDVANELWMGDDEDCNAFQVQVTGLNIGETPLSAGSVTTGNVQLNTGVNGLSTFGDNVNFNGLIQVQQATINQGTFSGSLTAVSGATVNMGGNRITNVGTPIAGTDAATKDYVDSLAGIGAAKDTEQDGRLDGVEAKNVEQDGRLDGHDTMLAAHQATLDTHTLQITDLDSRVATNTQDIASLDNRVTGLEASLGEGLARLDGRIDRAFEGAAMAMAMAAPAMPSDKNYALSINWGGFEGKNAFAGTAQARVSESFMIHGGIGVGSSGTMGGRAGLTYAW
ncbi:hypothetical protein MPL1032_160127 [Mesorhizobium plurifarium]|uniref:Trimeric autotransporter adhesin YadA-like C-terminal membrane anchor domain-containing protein n=1 Tax=Mesorhizobium plurifarium TaxID=69974 RepID=A0A0K2VSR8_MESPL|nr:hypothetical protein MPL1032_160127 [Mesorhizobium plurifarium]